MTETVTKKQTKNQMGKHTKTLRTLGILGVTAIILQGCNPFPDAMSGASLQIAKDGNSYYHQGEKKELKLGELLVVGEVEKEFRVDFNKIYRSSVVAKEFAMSDTGAGTFIGAYTYVGYSLHDILHPVKLKKKNSEEFRPNVDLYIEVENDKGEKVLFSWGEIFFTHHPNQVMIATEVLQVKPHKVDVDYPIGKNWRLIASGDYYNTRYLDNPTKIRICSFDKKAYTVNRELDPLYAPEVLVEFPDSGAVSITRQALDGTPLRYETVFYGMGMGYHPNDGFEGTSLNQILEPYLKNIDKAYFKNGMACFSAADGYRTVYSYSELFNSNNPVQTLMVVQEENSVNGRFRVFHPGDFFADRSVKALNEIYFFKE